jgi:AMMECR1 domain-containing protein
LLARLLCAQIMSMSIDEHKKDSRGRPKVDSEMVRARFERQTLNRVDEWRAEQPNPKPSRPEAVRRLVEKGLSK